MRNETLTTNKMLDNTPSQTAVAPYEKLDRRSGKMTDRASRLVLHMGGSTKGQGRWTFWSWDEVAFLFVWLGWLLGFNRAHLYTLITKSPELNARNYDSEGGGWEERIRATFEARFAHIEDVEKGQRTSMEGSNLGTVNKHVKKPLTWRDVLSVVNPALFGAVNTEAAPTPELVEANKRVAELEMQLSKANEHTRQMNGRMAGMERMMQQLAAQQGFAGFQDMVQAPAAPKKTAPKSKPNPFKKAAPKKAAPVVVETEEEETLPQDLGDAFQQELLSLFNDASGGV